MRDDELMDQLLRESMTEDVPQLSPGFDARVMECVRPRRLTSMGKVAMAVYVVAASATTAWLMHGLAPQLIVAAIVVTAMAVIGTSAYVRQLADRR